MARGPRPLPAPRLQGPLGVTPRGPRPLPAPRPQGPLGVKARGPHPLLSPRLRRPLGVMPGGPRPLLGPRIRGSSQEGCAHCLHLGCGAHWCHAKRALPTACSSATGETEGRDERARPPPEPRLQCGSSRISLRSLPLSRQGWKWSACSSSSYLVRRSIRQRNGTGKTHLLSRLAIPESQVITINPKLPVEEAAEDYAKKLSQAFQGDSIPVFDLLILGVGPDGHTCSLFPDHPLLQEREKIVAPISDSPKPPAQRVTLTLPVLNAARTVIFVATGEGKAAVLKRILEDKEENPLPAALVQPHTGKLCWFLDEAAARLLTVPFEKHSTL
ncbi:6-phosphogluconolactonase isoform X1 [Callithrix jacchus]|uniref:6-phosphogluconolactonase isoform X1 n=1 Tax=Callithrix jacchus TaxID=9483 RepID=UPI00159E3495|nr:6-phosphogluconolactonase isoform X1 [Callithrix jacchus]